MKKLFGNRQRINPQSIKSDRQAADQIAEQEKYANEHWQEIKNAVDYQKGE